MQHTISLKELAQAAGPQAQGMMQAIESCVHCGFCLPTCPTYTLLGEEMDSPRGRILLMKTVLEGELQVEEAAPYIDRCLGCLACVTACPSGVRYDELVGPFRAYAERRRTRPAGERLRRRLVQETLPYPARFRSAAALGKVGKALPSLVPGSLRPMLSLLPDRLPSDQPLPALSPALGKRRARVALLTGCVQQSLSPQINWATLRVLSQNGVEVVIPPDQGCCGALHLHTGQYEGARRLARHNLSVFPKDVDAVLTNAAGCGSGMKEYPQLFAEDPQLAEVEAFTGKVQDVSEFLDQLDLIPPKPLAQPLRVAYHDACHLANAQGVSEPPRRLLAAIPNLTLLEVPEGAICCGSAGTYNIDQPEIADGLGRRKAENILSVHPQAIALGNIGCLVQIQHHLEKLSSHLPVYHTFELLDIAYNGGFPKK
jgi:glycolate oxidase iron-sulfur subunit